MSVCFCSFFFSFFFNLLLRRSAPFAGYSLSEFRVRWSRFDAGCHMITKYESKEPKVNQIRLFSYYLYSKLSTNQAKTWINFDHLKYPISCVWSDLAWLKNVAFPILLSARLQAKHSQFFLWCQSMESRSGRPKLRSKPDLPVRATKISAFFESKNPFWYKLLKVKLE